MKIKCHLCLLKISVSDRPFFSKYLCKSSADESIWEVDDPFLCYYHWFRIYVDTIGVFHPVIWLPAVAASFHCRKWLPVNCSLFMSLASEEESPFWSLIVFRMCIEGELMSQISLKEYKNGRHMCCLYIVLCVYQRSMSSFVYSQWSILSLFVQGVIALGGGKRTLLFGLAWSLSIAPLSISPQSWLKPEECSSCYAGFHQVGWTSSGLNVWVTP